eukprot:6066055-Lingulodinium_polyedra.AAC.1
MEGCPDAGKGHLVSWPGVWLPSAGGVLAVLSPLGFAGPLGAAWLDQGAAALVNSALGAWRGCLLRWAPIAWRRELLGLLA